MESIDEGYYDYDHVAILHFVVAAMHDLSRTNFTLCMVENTVTKPDAGSFEGKLLLIGNREKIQMSRSPPNSIPYGKRIKLPNSNL